MVIFNNIKFDGFKVNMTFVCSLRIDFNVRRNLIWINRIHRDAATFLTYKSFRATSRQGQCDPSPLFKHRKTSETLCCRKIKRNFHCTVCHWLTYNWYLLKKKKNTTTSSPRFEIHWDQRNVAGFKVQRGPICPIPLTDASCWHQVSYKSSTKISILSDLGIL